MQINDGRTPLEGPTPDSRGPSKSPLPTEPAYRQDAIAVVGFANRLPGHNSNPHQLWDFLSRGGVAENTPPGSRFGLAGHYDGSLKPHTIKTPGAMFLEDHDPADFDAAFFKTPVVDAISMDPQQRMLLEVIYEGLENAGITLANIDGADFGCFVGSYAVDYLDMQMRDPEDRADGITIGAGRAILSNRVSHFLNIKGASMTIDTACSGSLVAVDVACRYLQTRQIDGAIVAGANLYLSPDQNQDMGAMRTASSPTGRCHTFDAKADGYCKSEAINCVILKRLTNALRDGDPIRAIIRGTATNSDGWTMGIASPSAEAQAEAIRAAYSAAGITAYHETGYLECHGTGTLAGDPVEVAAAASVLSQGRHSDNPLVIGSIKSNIGHSEPAAGVSGLIKAVLALEKNRIPGNPTFTDPNPRIDFAGLKVMASRGSVAWSNPARRIASVNSFGYGGSNAHVVLQDVESYLDAEPRSRHASSFQEIAAGSLFDDDDDGEAGDRDRGTLSRPQLFLFSANDEGALRANYRAVRRHLINPSVTVDMCDLAYTLSEKRSRLFHRGFVVASDLNWADGALVTGKESSTPPRLGLIFTGQGAQWPQMGKSLIDAYAGSRAILDRLDRSLQTLTDPPAWSIVSELYDVRSPEHMRLPEFSQPLVTALQIVLCSALNEWGADPVSVVGHSSGEIAAAYAAGFLTAEDAIRIAYLRGDAAKQLQDDSIGGLGMMAVGLGATKVADYIDDLNETVQIACYNSPNSVTLSGRQSDLEMVKGRLLADSHFARALQVNLAYHSTHMAAIGERYQALVEQNTDEPLHGHGGVVMFSSVTGAAMTVPPNASYWKTNMVSPVRFDEATTALLTAPDAANFLLELGPTKALAGPFAEIKKNLPGQGANIRYYAAAQRGPDSARALFEAAGHLHNAGGRISVRQVNTDERIPASLDPAIIVDLPNYAWNHTKKYWHESDASRDWRFRPYLHHDLLGSKILGTQWSEPTFSKILDLRDLPWLEDHRMGGDIVFPAAGFCAMVLEAMFQCGQANQPTPNTLRADELTYRLRNVTFNSALVLEKGVPAKIKTTLAPSTLGSHGRWYQFRISSSTDGTNREHSTGLVRLETIPTPLVDTAVSVPLTQTTPGHLWYKAMSLVGYGFGPRFQKHLAIESTSGRRESRSLVDLTEPASAWAVQSNYPLHPVALDGCFQTVTPSLVAGIRSEIKSVLIPAIIDDLIVFPNRAKPVQGISQTSSEYIGKGRRDDDKNYLSHATVFDPETRQVIVRLSGLRYHRLDTGRDPLEGHTLNQLLWMPDVSFLTPRSFLAAQASLVTATEQILDFVAHKKPVLRILEIHLDPGDVDSVWFTPSAGGMRGVYQNYTFASSDAPTVVAAQGRYGAQRAAQFSLADYTKPAGSASGDPYDLVVVKSTRPDAVPWSEFLERVREVMAWTGHIVILQAAVEGHAVLMSTVDPPSGFLLRAQVVLDDQQSVTVLAPPEAKSPSSRVVIKLINIAEPSTLSAPMLTALQRSGYDITVSGVEHVSREDTVLVVDELSSPLLAEIDAEKWEKLQRLLATRSRLLWVTHGAQMDVTHPENALIHGLLRTVRSEDPSLRLTTLDVERPSVHSAVPSISAVLDRIALPSEDTAVESEYVERGGIVYISRVRPDDAVNAAKVDGANATVAREGSLSDQKTLVRLRAERVGTLDGLVFGEVAPEELPMEPNHVEVDIHAAGLNFKDVAVTMGIVPENEHLLGLEGAGIVRRVASDVHSFRPGDRVVVFEKGTFANRIQVTTERTHKISPDLTFTDAATIVGVYLTSLYALFHLADLQKGQSILIHSAAGGIGISAIRLAQYKGADVYVTVGTDEKRCFLERTHGIPPSRIFSSRTTAFAREIAAETGGRGIDVILNSLTGELLDETWRLCADGGTMVEIGKRDILDRKQLTMEPFDRNCSYRALDFSHKEITDALIAQLLSTIFQLYAGGHIGPVHPVKTFPFTDIAGAFAYMRGGKHIGKVVITGPESGAVVPIRRARRSVRLRPRASYLVVGGLRGLCGSLAVSLARRGAEHVVVMSRSGLGDARSRKVIDDCLAHGCRVYDARGDVCALEDVRRAFTAAPFPVRGVIHGAMVLRDKPFESMTVSDFHAVLGSKVTGTRNLHSVSITPPDGPTLDFFTLLSSVSALVGQKGQANYAAANAYMDAFALHRRRHRHPPSSPGLAANSVSLGVVEDVGVVAERGGELLARHFDDRVWTGIHEAALCRILDLSILQQQQKTPPANGRGDGHNGDHDDGPHTSPINPSSAAHLITGISFPLPADSGLVADARFAALFAPLRQDGTAGDGEGGGSAGAGAGARDAARAVQLMLRSGAEAGTVLDAVVRLVGGRLAATLRLGQGEVVEPGRPPAAYGLDSLSAVELRNWLRVELGAELSTLEINGAASVVALCEKVIGRIGRAGR